ncbi:MAG: transcription termination/antitermination protein NusA [Dehalococcoidia bacterium]|nr:MAG: transcription termination/antitermination protein NusA [Dehalococcoidia bacterium]
MKTEFMVALTQLSAEKHLPKEVVLTAIESALTAAYKKDAFAPEQDISTKINPTTGEVKVYVKKTVVETPTNLLCEISLAEAQKLDKSAQIGDIANVESTPPHAGRIAAQTARQVILQRLHEAEYHVIYEEFTSREGDIVTGMVQRITPEQIYIDLGKTDAILPSSEQIHNERYRTGQRFKFYLLEVTRTSKGPQILVSRSHRNLLRKLLELEIPEIYAGTIALKSVAREAGYRSKVAVAACQEGVDPVGCCVGLRGIRIQSIANELNGEKIDVIKWSDDPAVFIANALSPAQVSSVKFNGAEGTAVVTVPDKQLSLAIGKEGQNARLAAKLTGWRIDIKSISASTAEMASLSREATVEAEEPTTGMEELVPELVTAEEPLTPEPLSEPELVGEKEFATSTEPVASEPVGEEAMAGIAAASTDYELVLTSELQPPVQSAEAPQIRFAEDIMPARSTKAKAKKGGMKDADLLAGKSKSKKTHQRQASYSEEDELEELSETANSSAEAHTTT